MAQVLMQWTNSFRKSFIFSENNKPLLNPNPFRTTTIVEQFEAIESFILENNPFDPKKYLSIVDDLLELKNNEILVSDTELVDRVSVAVEIAMKRLANEFWSMLFPSVLAVDPEQLCREISSLVCRISSASVTDDNDPERVINVKLMNNNDVVELSEIAQRMIKGGYEKNCWEAFSSVRHDVLYECLCVLGAEPISIEKVQKLESELLQKKMKNWIKGVKMITRYLLFAEKDLCNDIFEGFEQIAIICFKEIVKSSMMELHNFAEVIMSVKHEPEMLVRVFDMYNTLAKSMVELKTVLSYDSSDLICSETEHVITGLGKATINIFEEFEYRVRNDPTEVTPNGEVHRMVRYVMNYLLLLVDSMESFGFLLQDQSGGDDSDSNHACLMEERLCELVTSMEVNIVEKSQEYEDESLRAIFLMNNNRYLVQKVQKYPELKNLFGEYWIRKRISETRKCSKLYLRSTWKNVLYSLRFDKKISDCRVKEKFRQFNAAFEEICKRQSGWVISEPQLRDELRIAVMERVIPAYRGFLGRVSRQVDRLRHPDKYMKYEIDDIENCLMELFQGGVVDSPGVMNWKDRVASGREFFMGAIPRVK